MKKRCFSRWWLSIARPACLGWVCAGLVACAPLASVREIRPKVPAAALGRTRDALAEGRRHERAGDTPAALGAYLAAGSEAARALQSREHLPAAEAAYNDAVSRVVSLVSRQRLEDIFRLDGLTVPGPDGRPYRLTARWDRRLIDPPGRYDFVPTDELQIGGTAFTRRIVVPGIGAPGVAIRNGETSEEAHADFTSAGKTYATITAVLRFQGTRATLDFQDPLAHERVALGNGYEGPLAADYTSSIALVLAREKPQRLGLVRLLRPERYEDTARLVRLQPYDPTRIPVLLVHGLQDTPATWVQMLNVLRADPEIRRRYQFWLFSYPSGNPFPYSAMLLREELDGVRRRYPGHAPMVIVGHSMGGLLTRLMITDSGLAFWKTFFRDPPEATPLRPADRQVLERILIFDHRPEASEAVFISTPHRGSEIASSWIGRTVSRLVLLPKTLVSLGAATLEVVTLDQGRQKMRRMPNSIDSLAPGNRFMRTMDTLPIAAGIPFHSIMGDRGRGDTPDSSDGVVAYRSSHLDGAASERIVPSGHNAHQNTQAIEEVRRILHAHLHSSPR